MKKALFVANLDSFHKNFHIPYIKRLKERGYEVELVSTGNVDFSELAVKHDIVFGHLCSYDETHIARQVPNYCQGSHR